MKAQCLPFSQIPHTTRLFADFLSYSPKVWPFYPRSPRFVEWFKDAASNLRYLETTRKQVSDILERQNRGWNASAKTLENVARLRAGAAAVVTGQQVGLFGGPLFSIFKALTAVKLAEEATAGGVDCVPVFWLATQDHDLEEVSHVALPQADASLPTLTASTHSLRDAPVGAITFGAEVEPVVAAAAELLGDSEITKLLHDSYRPGETFGSAFARLFAGLFGEWGVILLDASDPELSKLSQPVYRAAIERAAELNDKLLARGRELEAADYHQQVKITAASTLLFALRNGSRVPVHMEPRKGEPAEFRIEKEVMPQSELLRRIDAEPQNFSANVLLRPIKQDYLLPTIAYTGGPAEVAYFAQAAVVYETLAENVTAIVPRFSATLIEHKAEQLLERYHLSLLQVFCGPDQLRERLAAHSLAQDLQRSFEQAELSVEKSLADIREKLVSLDKTLLDSATHAGEKMKYQLTQLRARAARAELRHTEVLARHADFLSATLYPNKTMQEREVAGVHFLSRHGLQLLRGLYDTIRTDCLEHQAITLD